METQGGTLQIDTERNHFSFGLGWHDGLRAGFALETPFAGGRLALGDQFVPFVLPTDLFNQSFYFDGRGAGFHRETDRQSIFLFGGFSSESLNTPFVNAASPDRPLGAFFYRRTLGPHFSLASFTVFSEKLTAIESLEWRPLQGWSFAASGGVGHRAPYGAGSARIHEEKFDILASYTLTNRTFRRLRLSSPLTTEADGGNVRLDFRPWNTAGISFGHQDLLAPESDGTSVRARVNGLTAWIAAGGFRMHSSVFRSRGASGASEALLAGIERPLTSRFDARVEYFRSKTASTPVYQGFDSGLREKINSHLAVSQTFFTDGRQHTLSYGGQFQSNALDLGVDYQTIFVPFSLPHQPSFRQVVAVNLRLRFWRGIELHAATNYTPFGQTRYTAYATGEAYSNGSQPIAARRSRGAIAPFIIRGRVQDEHGHPVFGAALLIDRREVFTDSDGVFVLRRKKPGQYSLKVKLNAFLFPQEYEVVSAPARVPAAEEGSPRTFVVVLRSVAPTSVGELNAR